ncbi:MAG: sensor histidine kinase [Methylococcales bacterium]|nr:sensor histidine kinase [Methylococcales bacterium]
MTAALILYQTHENFLHETASSAESIDKQLEVQLLFGTAKGIKTSVFLPDFNFWTKSENSSGLCVHYEQIEGKVKKSACRGVKITKQWPSWFKKTYHHFFQPGNKVIRPITFRNKVYGFVIVSSSVEAELGQAWHDIKTMMKLSIITIMSLCTLLYFAIDWALRPARQIVSGLEKMAQGDLSLRLADFKFFEWQRTGQAINFLAENLEKTLSDKNQLTIKLVNVQEEERRYLTRELHDEFGQSLAGLAAITSSMAQTAAKECPELVSESQTVRKITQHMMTLLREMLTRLRPTDFDEFGLIGSLRFMIAEWNSRSVNKTRFNIEIVGDFDDVPDNISHDIFRIVQECLTNVSKHSKAKNASVKLEIVIPVNSILLIVEDNGIGDNNKISGFPGIGLLGIRERVTGLKGRLTLKKNKPKGVIVQVWIPLQPNAENHKFYD